MARKRKRMADGARPEEARAPLDLRVSGPGVDARLLASIRDSADLALAAFTSHIDRVKVHVTGATGPGGGRVKECQVKVMVDGGPPVVVKERDGAARQACAIAAGLAESAMRRLFDRQGWPIEAAQPEAGGQPAPAGEEGEITGRPEELASERTPAALEGSAQERPARKSTRRFPGHIKRDAPQRITRTVTVRSAKARHARAAARGGSGGE